ncbi:MAG: SDR family oxidoreductase [Phycisphaerales bacterium]|nr:SDR family oxidoreductase [Phycisphaerales bacterium]
MGERVAMVTGAGSGIGRAIAEALAADGCRVVLAGRTAKRLVETQNRIAASGGESMVHMTDVTDRASIEALMHATVERFGRLDVLVNNAATAVVAAIAEIDAADFDQMLQINTAGVVYMCRAAWPLLAQSGRGVIVNVSSLAATDPFPGLTAYGATKAFVSLLTKGLAGEGKPHGIRVYGVAPGAVETDMLRSGFPDFPADQCLQPSDVAALVVTLASDRMQHSVGQTIEVRK